MPIISHMGVDYDSPNVQIQDNASATDLDNTKVPTGQTIESYVSSNYCPKTPTVIALNTITWKITYNSTYTFFYKIGRVVYFQLYWGGTASTNTEIAVLPNSLKPLAAQNWFPIFNNLGGSYYGRLNIQSTGSVSALCSTSVDYAYSSGFYIAAS